MILGDVGVGNYCVLKSEPLRVFVVTDYADEDAVLLPVLAYVGIFWEAFARTQGYTSRSNTEECTKHLIILSPPVETTT